jgi:predicted nucleic acid-binding protein
MSRLVIDASIVLSWLLPDEAAESSVEVQAEIPKAESVWVAAHWHLEVANSLCMAERRKRLDAAGIAQAVSLFTQLPVSVDPETKEHSSAQTLSLARQHMLSVYDAAYLELALRRGATLATLDRPLRVVARQLGVPILPEKLSGEAN